MGDDVLHGNFCLVAERVARSVLSKDRPPFLFQGLFFDLREKVREIKTKMSVEVRDQIEKQLRADIVKLGYQIVELSVKLGRYRGSEFVTTAKVTAKSKGGVADSQLLKLLQTTYHPNYQNKGVVDGNVVMNIR